MIWSFQVHELHTCHSSVLHTTPTLLPAHLRPFLSLITPTAVLVLSKQALLSCLGMDDKERSLHRQYNFGFAFFFQFMDVKLQIWRAGCTWLPSLLHMNLLCQCPEETPLRVRFSVEGGSSPIHFISLHTTHSPTTQSRDSLHVRSGIIIIRTGFFIFSSCCFFH